MTLGVVRATFRALASKRAGDGVNNRSDAAVPYGIMAQVMATVCAPAA